TGRMLTRLWREVPATVALLGLRSRQSAIRNACIEILRERVAKREWDIVDALRRSQRKSYSSLFFELACDASIPVPDHDHRRSLTEFRILQLVAREPPGATTKEVLKNLKSMRPRIAAIRFGEAMDRIRRGHIDQVGRAIAASNLKESLPMI